MTAAVVIVVVLLFLVVLFLISAIKVAREYERGIVFRLGRLLPEPKGPGLFILIPIVDRMVKVDLRTITLTIPPQEVITKDNVPVRVNAVAYFRIVEPKNAIVQVENFMVATSQIAQTTLRSVLEQVLTEDGAEGRLRDLGGRDHEVLHLDDRVLGLDDPEIGDRVHPHRDVVLGDDLLRRDGQRDRPQVDLDHPVDYRDQDEQARALRLRQQPAQAEDDSALVLARHLDRRDQEEDDQEEKDDDDDDRSGHAGILLGADV